MILSLINKKKVKNMNELKNSILGKKILIQKNFVKWIQLSKENQSQGFLSFISKLKLCYFASNFSLFSSMMNVTTTEEWENKIEEFKKNEKIAFFLFKELKKNKINEKLLFELSNAINKGLNSFECPMNDCILFLANLIDSNKLNKTLNNCTKQCLNEKFKNEKKYQYFNNNLLNSNIWSKINNKKNFKLKIKKKNENEETIEQKIDNNNNNNNDQIIYYNIKLNIINEELKENQLFIKNQINEMENKFSKS